jgi:hypothetical protein
MWSPCEEALAAPDGATFDALISADIGLPDGDGWEPVTACQVRASVCRPRPSGRDKETREAHRPTWIHRFCAGRAQPLESGWSGEDLASAETCARRRSPLRPRDRAPVSPRCQAASMAAGQSAWAMHDGPTYATAVQFAAAAWDKCHRETARRLGRRCFNVNKGAKRSPCFLTRLNAASLSKTSLSASPFFATDSTSDHRSGVETFGCAFARSE